VEHGDPPGNDRRTPVTGAGSRTEPGHAAPAAEWQLELEHRQQRLSERLDDEGLDAFFCPASSDLEYLVGFARKKAAFGLVEYQHQWVEGAFFRPGQAPLLVVTGALPEFARSPGGVGDVVSVAPADDAVALFASAVRSLGPLRRIGVSGKALASTLLQIGHAAAGAELTDDADIVTRMRMVKSAAEIVRMDEACAIADRAWADLLPRVRAGVTEIEIAAEVDHLMHRHGAYCPAFDTGVFAIGPNDLRDASLRLTRDPVRPGDGICFDFGAALNGYCSDFGRTIHVGDPDEEYLRCYDVVLAAQAAAAAAAVPGASGAEVHRVTRAVFEDAGIGRWFRHLTGHCVGLDTHEPLFLSGEEARRLESGMVFTLEPSVFWPGRMGMRVEDVFVCEEGGGRRLNRCPLDLVVV